MSENEYKNRFDEFVLIVTIPDSAADRVTQLLLDAGIEPGGGGTHGVTGVVVQRRHQPTAQEIIAKDAEEHGYACNFCEPIAGLCQQTDRFSAAIRRFDEENAHDPNLETAMDAEHPHEPVHAQPRELLYAKRLTDWVLKLDPGASEELRLAARCQHICRWMIPRDSYPMTRAGYLKWRQDLKEFHAKKAGEILMEVGYPPHTVDRVQALNLKRHLAADAEMQTLEDALCLVFLEHQLGPLLEKTSEEKVITALKKSWAKMSPRGREVALALPLSARELEIVRRSLEGL